MTEPSVFDQRDLERLRAFRRAAADVMSSTVMRDGEDIGLSVSARVGEPVVISRRGPDNERFRSFVIGLRRTYGDSHDAHFLSVRNILSRRCEDRRDSLKQLKDAYLAALRSREVEMDGYSHKEVFEAWLYGSLFHDDDPELRSRWKKLTDNPLTAAAAFMLVQVTAVRLANLVYYLDQIIAEVLDEDPLLPPGSPGGEKGDS